MNSYQNGWAWLTMTWPTNFNELKKIVRFSFLFYFFFVIKPCKTFKIVSKSSGNSELTCCNVVAFIAGLATQGFLDAAWYQKSWILLNILSTVSKIYPIQLMKVSINYAIS